MILVVTLIAMVTGSICMNKVSPVLTYIVSDFSIDNSTYSGLLISVFVISGIILSIPMGILITKHGTFKTGFLSLVCIILGSILGAIAGNYALLIVSRIIEGVGLMFLATIGPAVVASSFSDESRGTAMGILMCFMAIGQIIAFNIAPVIASSSSWQNFWWVSAVLGIIALVLWVIFISGSDPNTNSPQETIDNDEDVAAGTSLKNILTNSGIWLVSLTIFAYTLSHMGVLNYLPTYLTEVAGLSTTTAGSITSIAFIVGIPVGIIGGVIADKCGSRKIVLGLSMVVLAVAFGLLQIFNSSSYAIFAVIYGVASMAQAGLCFTSVTEVVSVKDSGTASAVLNTAQWSGVFLSTILFGTLLGSFGWGTSFYIMIPIALFGAITTFINKRLK